jgi:hypothetical protein
MFVGFYPENIKNVSTLSAMAAIYLILETCKYVTLGFVFPEIQSEYIYAYNHYNWNSQILIGYIIPSPFIIQYTVHTVQVSFIHYYTFSP